MGVQQSEAMAVWARADPPAVLAEIYPEPLTVTESPVRSVAAAAGLITILLPGRGATARLPGRTVRIVRQPAPAEAAGAATMAAAAGEEKPGEALVGPALLSSSIRPPRALPFPAKSTPTAAVRS